MPSSLDREHEQDAASETGDDGAAAAELDARGFENGLVPRPEEERVAYNRKDQMRNKLQARHSNRLLCKFIARIFNHSPRRSVLLVRLCCAQFKAIFALHYVCVYG